jgi:mutator protein MutT
MSIKVAIAVVEQNGCFLIGQRPEGIPLAGLWEFPGGKILPGETAEAAAIRECLEETSIRVENVLHLLSVGHEYEHGTLALEFVACRPIQGEHALPSHPFRWVRREELANYQFPAANAAVLEVLARTKTQSGSTVGPD